MQIILLCTYKYYPWKEKEHLVNVKKKNGENLHVILV